MGRKHLHTMQAERRTLRANESQLLSICKSFGGEETVRAAKRRAAHAELGDLKLQCNDARRSMNTVSAECNASAACQFTVITNQWASDVARDIVSRDFTTATYRVNQMEAALINWCTQVHD